MAKKTTKKAVQNSATDVLVIPSKKATLSTPQKAYNRYIKQIDKHKVELKNAEKEVDKLQQRIYSEVFPEMDKLQELRLKRLEKIDEFLGQRLSQNHSNELHNIFFDEISLIVAESNVYPMNDELLEKIIEIHDKHADISYEEVMNEGKEEALEYMKSNLEHFGIDDVEIDGMDIENMKRILEAIDRKRDEENNEREQKRMDSDEKYAAKKNAEKDQEKERTKTLKGIYKRLVKELHPDLEADIDEQARKNELMQRVTIAYNENDFFELLKLNIEYQTQNKGDISNLADQEIEYYNQILKSQVQELKMNIKAIKSSFLYEYYGGSPQRTGQIIRRCKEKIASEKKQYQEVTTNNFGSLKGWKKSLKNKLEDDEDSIFALIFGVNSEEMEYKEKMDFLYGSQKHNHFGF